MTTRPRRWRSALSPVCRISSRVAGTIDLLQPVEGIGNAHFQFAAPAPSPSAQAIIAAQQDISPRLFGGSDVDRVRGLAGKLFQFRSTVPHVSGQFENTLFFRQKQLYSGTTLRVGNRADFDHRHLRGYVRPFAAVDSLQNQDHCLGLQADAHLTLIVKWPAETRHVQVNLQGGSSPRCRPAQPVLRFYAAATGTAYLLDRPEPRVW